MRRARKVAALLAALALCLSQTGCYDRRELNTLGFVVGVGIDATEEGEGVELTLQLANVSGSVGGKGGSKTSKEDEGASAEAFVNLSDTGPTVNTVLRDFEHHLSRRIYMPHMQIMVIGEDMARQGVRDSLDFFARAKEPRMTMYLVVAKGKAKEILDVKPQLEQYTASALMQLVGDQDTTSDTPIVTLFSFVRELMKKSSAAVLPIVETGEQGLEVGGCAVFKRTVMVGELNREETRGMLWITGKVEKGIINVNYEGATAALEISSAVRSLEYGQDADGTDRFRIKVSASFSLGDQTGPVNLSRPDVMTQVVELCRQEIIREMELALEKARELEADVFGFGEHISRYAPQRWAQIESNWDEVFEQVGVEFEVTVKGNNPGKIIAPLDTILE